MTIEKLRRVLRRVSEWEPDRVIIRRKTLMLAIMHECGTAEQTYLDNRNALIKLGWIKRHNRRFLIKEAGRTEIDNF